MNSQIHWLAPFSILLGLLLCFLLLSPHSLRGQTFADVTGSGDGHGGSWGDYNNDGHQDLYVNNGGGQADQLYRNNGNGTFTNVLFSAGIADAVTGNCAAWGGLR